MDEPNPAGVSELSQEEQQSILFLQLVMQQANMAMMLMGRLPPPDGAKPMRDLGAARLFIDQLEVLQARTKGNLTKDEDAWFKQNLMALHMAFVKASEEPESTPAPEPSAAAAENKTAPAGEAGAVDEESRKRFSKKYSS